MLKNDLFPFTLYTRCTLPQGAGVFSVGSAMEGGFPTEFSHGKFEIKNTKLSLKRSNKKQICILFCRIFF